MTNKSSKSNKSNITYHYEYYPNKNYKILYGLDLNGKLSGLYEEYYDYTNYFKLCNYKNYNYSNRQQIKIRCYYSDDKLNGSYEKYFPNGLLHKKCYYSNGDLNGTYEEYFNDCDFFTTHFKKKAVLKIKSNYVTGELNGICIGNHANGKLFYIKEYKHNKLVRKNIINKHF